MMEFNLRFIDAAIVLLYLVSMGVIAYVVARRQRNKEDYLVAGRKMHWFPVSLSNVAATFSAISLMGAPGFVIGNDMRFLPSHFTLLISIPIIFYIVLPFLYKLQMVSVYEYLENRFCPAIRMLASFMFMATKLGYLAMVIYAPSLALTAVTGLNITLLIIIFGLITTICTVAGGLEGVIWTEMVQYFVIIAGVLAIILFLCFSSTAGDVGLYWHLAKQAGKTKMLDFSFDIKSLSIWVLILSGTILGVANLCNDQTNIQRLFAAKSLKDAAKGYLFGLIFGTPLVVVLYFIGAWLFGFFQSGHVMPDELIQQPDRVFPYFVAKYMPVGLTGLIFAGIFAAGMSTISAVIHSLTSLFMVDFYERFSNSTEEGKHYVLISRCVSMSWGIAAILGAFYVMKLGNTIIEVSSIMAGFLAAPLGGIYFLGIFTKRANTPGATIGGIAGIITTSGTFLLNRYEIVPIHFVWFGLFGIIATCIVGYLASLLFPPLPEQKLANDKAPAAITMPG